MSLFAYFIYLRLASGIKRTTAENSRKTDSLTPAGSAILVAPVQVDEEVFLFVSLVDHCPTTHLLTPLSLQFLRLLLSPPFFPSLCLCIACLLQTFRPLCLSHHVDFRGFPDSRGSSDSSDSPGSSSGLLPYDRKFCQSLPISVSFHLSLLHR